MHFAFLRALTVVYLRSLLRENAWSEYAERRTGQHTLISAHTGIEHTVIERALRDIDGSVPLLDQG